MNRALLASVLCVSLCACGAAPPPSAQTPADQAAPHVASSPPPLLPAPAPPPASIVRFDDLGVSFAVPAGFKVLGDDELASRIRASANPRLTASLEARGQKQKGIPLLSLARDTADRDGALAVTISVTIVPADATAAELLAHQQSAMATNLDSFRVTAGPAEHAQDGVVGAELAGAYVLKSAGQARQTGSFMRMFVRKGVAYLAVAVWPEASAREEEARLMLDGLRFYEPAP